MATGSSTRGSSSPSDYGLTSEFGISSARSSPQITGTTRYPSATFFQEFGSPNWSTFGDTSDDDEVGLEGCVAHAVEVTRQKGHRKAVSFSTSPPPTPLPLDRDARINNIDHVASGSGPTSPSGRSLAWSPLFDVERRPRPSFVRNTHHPSPKRASPSSRPSATSPGLQRDPFREDLGGSGGVTLPIISPVWAAKEASGSHFSTGTVQRKPRPSGMTPIPRCDPPSPPAYESYLQSVAKRSPPKTPLTTERSPRNTPSTRTSLRKAHIRTVPRRNAPLTAKLQAQGQASSALEDPFTEPPGYDAYRQSNGVPPFPEQFGIPPLEALPRYLQRSLARAAANEEPTPCRPTGRWKPRAPLPEYSAPCQSTKTPASTSISRTSMSSSPWTSSTSAASSNYEVRPTMGDVEDMLARVRSACARGGPESRERWIERLRSLLEEDEDVKSEADDAVRMDFL